MVDFRGRVTSAGVNEAATTWLLLRRSDGAYQRWFYAPNNTEREILETALAAISTGLPVNARLESENPESRIDAFVISY